MPVKGLALTNREQAWMIMGKGMRWCTGQATTGRKHKTDHPILTNMEAALLATFCLGSTSSE